MLDSILTRVQAAGPQLRDSEGRVASKGHLNARKNNAREEFVLVDYGENGRLRKFEELK